MRGKRMWHTLRLYTILRGPKRTEYFKKNNIFHSMGDNCLIMDRKVPLFAKLISLGNNVRLASNVTFITHDGTHRVLNKMKDLIASRNGQMYPEKVGCISIGDNVFIGSGTCITYNVKIGSNVIVGAGSLINRDIPDNCVVAGVPAKVIKTFDEFVAKRDLDEAVSGIEGETVTPDAEKRLWEKFRKDREKKDRQ